MSLDCIAKSDVAIETTNHFVRANNGHRRRKAEAAQRAGKEGEGAP